MKFWTFFRGMFSAMLMSLAIQSCTTEPKPPVKNQNIPLSKVLILCEGNFLWENAQLDVWLPDSQTLISNVFEKQNNKPIGDILQSGLYSNGRLFLCVNNSGKIIELDPKSLVESQKSITASYPRFLCQFEANQNLYVTDLKLNQISELDQTNLKTLSTFKVLPQKNGEFSGWTEHIVSWNQKIAAANLDGNLMLLDPTKKESKLVKIDTGARFLNVDKFNQLWVACSEGKKSALVQMKPDESFVTHRFNFNIQRISLGGNKDTLWLLTGNLVYFVKLSESNAPLIPQKAFSVDGAQNLYSLGIHPQTGEFYLGDARDYVSQGKVHIYDSRFNFKKSFETGVIPTDFIFVGL